MTRPPGLSLRVELTLSYAGFLVVAGLVTGVIGVLVLRWVPDTSLQIAADGSFAPSRSDLLEAAAPRFAAALALLVLVGLAGGWFLAGWVLRPLGELSAAVRRVGEGSLSHRVRLPGRGDELRALADGVDDMLARLERTFLEQQRFTANASHELRTPVAAARTVLEVARADPAGRDVDGLLARLTELNDRQAATLESVLLLARAERGQVRLADCDLVEVLEDALEHLGADVPVDLAVPPGPVPVAGDRALLDHLAQNLVRNAGAHGAGTAVHAEVRRAGDAVVLEVSNGGPALDPDLVGTLAEPFVRGAGRTGTGSGLGLAIVASVCRAHGAVLQLAPRAGGGLTVLVRFPAHRPPGRS